MPRALYAFARVALTSSFGRRRALNAPARPGTSASILFVSSLSPAAPAGPSAEPTPEDVEAAKGLLEKGQPTSA